AATGAEGAGRQRDRHQRQRKYRNPGPGPNLQQPQTSLLCRPAGLAVGLALKEPALPPHGGFAPKLGSPAPELSASGFGIPVSNAEQCIALSSRIRRRPRGTLGIARICGVPAVSEPHQPRLRTGRREGERVTPLELFFDLVFVLAITQCTALMSHRPTWSGVGQGLLVLGVLWWGWTGYAWL